MEGWIYRTLGHHQVFPPKMKIFKEIMSSKTISEVKRAGRLPWFALGGALVLAITVRLLLLSFLHHNYFLTGITVAEGEMAYHLARGRGFVINPSHMNKVAEQQNRIERLVDIMDVPSPEKEVLEPYHHALPGYALLLSFFYRVTGKARYLELQIFQAILDSIGVFLVYILTRRTLGSTSIGIISAYLYALWIPQARLSIAPLHDAPMAFLLLLSTLIFFEGEKKNSKGLMALSAVLLGLSAYIRSDYIFLPAFFAVAAFIKRARGEKRALMLINGFWMVCLVFLILLPWGLRNYVTFHRFTILRPVLWQSIWEGFGEFSNPFGAVLDDKVAFEMVQKEHPKISYFDPEYQEILRNKSLKAIKEHPEWFIMMLPRRFLRMLFAVNDWGFLPESNFSSFKAKGGGFLDYLSTTDSLQIFLRVVRRIVENGLVFMALAGLILLRKRWRYLTILLSVPACGFLMHLPIYWEPRYLLPGNFPFLILAGVAIEAIYQRAKTLHSEACRE